LQQEQQQQPCQYDGEDLKTLGDAVERALNFFEANLDALVLDAAVGTRSLQSQLASALRLHPLLPPPIRDQLRHLEVRGGRLTERIAQKISTSPRVSYNEKLHTLPWVTTPGLWEWPVGGRWEESRELPALKSMGLNASALLLQSRETIEEKQSDACIFQLFNCGQQKMSEECRRLFVEGEQSLYSLTHQVIYTLFAEKNKCYNSLRTSEALRAYQKKLCSKVWVEANAIWESGTPPHFSDLFVEQIAICGMAGFPNFLRRDWLLQILQWQSKRKSGCFVDPRLSGSGGAKRPPPIQPSTAALLLTLYRTNRTKFFQLMDRHYNHIRPTSSDPYRQKVTSRQKRSDAFLRQGGGAQGEECSVHFTAVGLSALGLHMRYFIDTCFAGY
jgi:hypothetical protein